MGRASGCLSGCFASLIRLTTCLQAGSCSVSTFLVDPPPFDERVFFMDALDQAGIEYAREPDGYFMFLKEGQEYTLRAICCRFHAEIVQEDPPMLVDL